MTLQGICDDPKERVYQAVVANLGEQCLFVGEGVLRDDLRRRVRYLSHQQSSRRFEKEQRTEVKAIFGIAGAQNQPIEIFRLSVGIMALTAATLR